MASEDTPVNNKDEIKSTTTNELPFNEEEFTKEIDALKKKYDIADLIVACTPNTGNKEVVYISDKEYPYFCIETANRLLDFYVSREIAKYKAKHERFVSIMEQVKKVISGEADKPPH